MQYFRAISPRNCTPFLRGTICPQSSQVRFFLEVFGRSAEPYFFSLLTL